MVDLGGSLAVASRGLFATGVSTDLNGKFNEGLVDPRGGGRYSSDESSHVFEFWRKDWG